MILFLTLLLVTLTSGKVYDRCELARELKYIHKASNHQLATWVCIAEHESQYNTGVVGHKNGDGSGDHGIFQISDQFWCSPPGKGYACGLTCADLEDDDISDDFECAKRIYKEHKTLSGDGFNAWAVYNPHCKGSKAAVYVKDCFKRSENSTGVAPDAPPPSPSGFAHGFFDTAAGKEREGKGLLTSTERPSLDARLGSPERSSFDAPPSSPEISSLEALLNAPERPSFDNFLIRASTSYSSHPPVSSSDFVSSTPSSTTGFVPTSAGSTDSSFMSFTPSTSSPPTLVPPNSGSSSFLDSSRFFFTPSTTRSTFFTPTASSVYQTNVFSVVDEPVFIFNGMKWYK